MCTVYKITNLANGKTYIGQTWYSLSQRFSSHLSDARRMRNGWCPKLGYAIRKYGREGFRIEVLGAAGAQAAADYLECHFIKEYDSVVNGYNLKSGGSHGKHSAESKARMSASHRGHVHTVEHRAKISLATKGRKHSEQTKAKIAASHLGIRPSEETKLRLAAASTGHKHSVEHRAKISQGLVRAWSTTRRP